MANSVLNIYEQALPVNYSVDETTKPRISNSTKGQSVNDVKLYPNPATHEIQISGSIADTARLRIYDQLGRSYADVMLDGDRRLNVSSWPDGVYIYSITPREGGEKIEGKLIIIK
ncbi:MAG: T9SS type A sorting domain-containing protein [Lewinellaceae bacterium]|nr:T9SS type A sorting domain-containing protein [Lewinellaceae bacterium]